MGAEGGAERGGGGGEREREGEKEREREREREADSPLSTESGKGLYLRTLRS